MDTELSRARSISFPPLLCASLVISTLTLSIYGSLSSSTAFGFNSNARKLVRTNGKWPIASLSMCYVFFQPNCISFDSILCRFVSVFIKFVLAWFLVIDSFVLSTILCLPVYALSHNVCISCEMRVRNGEREKERMKRAMMITYVG